MKLAVAGDGGADKFEVQEMVMRLCTSRELPDPPDAADALALALCHLWRGAARGARARSPAARSSKLDDAIAAALAKETRTVIGSVRGSVLERLATGEVLVEVGGVGYRAFVPAGALPALHPGDPDLPVHAPARARRRDGALRLPDAR